MESENRVLDPEFVGELIDCVEDLLQEQGVRLPRTVKESSADEIDGPGTASIIGQDYDELADKFLALLRSWTNGTTICPYVAPENDRAKLAPEIHVTPGRCEKGVLLADAKDGRIRVEADIKDGDADIELRFPKDRTISLVMNPDGSCAVRLTRNAEYAEQETNDELCDTIATH